MYQEAGRKQMKVTLVDSSILRVPCKVKFRGNWDKVLSEHVIKGGPIKDRDL